MAGVFDESVIALDDVPWGGKGGENPEGPQEIERAKSESAESRAETKSNKIGFNDHSFVKHSERESAQFEKNKIFTPQDYASKIKSSILNAEKDGTVIDDGSGKISYYDSGSNFLVHWNPLDPEGGTAFFPDAKGIASWEQNFNAFQVQQYEQID